MERLVSTVLFRGKREDLNNCKLTFESFNVFLREDDEIERNYHHCDGNGM